MASRRTRHIRRALLSTAAALTVALVVQTFGVAPLAEGVEPVEDRAANLTAALSGIDRGDARTATLLSGAWETQVPSPLPNAADTLPTADEETVALTDTAPVLVDLGGMDVTVTATDPLAGGEATLSLTVADPETADAAGVDGVLVDVVDTDGTSGATEVEITVDYSGFADLNGGDWASRLQLVEVPACATETPEDPACQPLPLLSTNDPESQTLTGVVPVTTGAAVAGRMATAATGSSSIGVTSSASGPAGNWAASPLNPTSTWAASGASGAFTWSYPLQVPRLVPGPAPELTLTYSSAAADGRTPASNNQAGWIGEGFDLSTGYIERSYVPCGDDEEPVSGKGAANNEDHPSLDLCWGRDNATLILGGSATPLVKTADGWVPKDDDGTLIERVTSGGEDHWQVTTVDGVRYLFGQDKDTTASSRHSAWTVPVYGNHTSEPCYDTDFADSRCAQVWRWNLDEVIDPVGNTMTYHYAVTSNHYIPNVSDGLTQTAVRYTAGGHLDHIDYGSHTSDTTALARIDFTSADRCLTDRADGGSLCGAGTTDEPATNWPDVPKDLECAQAADCENYTPVFFQTTRLTKVTAQVRDGGTFTDADEWVFGHRYAASTPNASTEYASSLILTLDSVTHIARGMRAGVDDIELPAVLFGYDYRANRVDGPDDGAGALVRPRVNAIRTESGGQLSIAYAEPECTPANSSVDPAPATQQNNTRLCYPVRWQQAGVSNPRVDWFHKTVLAQVVENAAPKIADVAVTGSPAVITRYTYGDAAWVQPTGSPAETVDPDEPRTYAEFRGVRTVSSAYGDPGAPIAETSTYYLGVGGTLTGGSGSEAVTVTDNLERNAGRPFKTTVFDGATVLRETVTEFGQPTTIASSNGGPAATRATRTTVHGYTYRADGDLEHATSASTWLNGNAQPVTVTDTATGTCTRTTYTSSGLGANMVAFPSATSTYEGTGDNTGCSGTLASKSAATYYPTGLTYTTTTYTDSSTGITNQTYEYDARGRVTRSTDAAGNATNTSYTSTGRLVSAIITTLPMSGFVTTQTIDRLTGAVLSVVDANGKETTGTYDALERVTAVRYPQHASSAVPSVEYEYTVQGNGLNSVLTRTISASGDSQHVSGTYYDGLLRPYQTQTEGKDAGTKHDAEEVARGRVVTHTLYDDAGRVATALGAWKAKGAVSTGGIVPEYVPPARTDYEYDDAGRVTSERFCIDSACTPGDEEWATTTSYDGARTLTIPATGGVPTVRTLDAAGRLTTLTEYLRDPDTHAAVDTPAEVGALPTQTTGYSYDPLGRMTGITDTEGNEWTYTFDLAGRQTGATDPDAGTTLTTYDDLGRVETRTNGNGQTLWHGYDALSRRTELRDTNAAGTLRATWHYDTATITGGESARGQLTTATRYLDGLQYATSTLDFDDAYRPLTVRTALPTSAALGGLSGKSFDTGYTYTADGQLASTTLPEVTNGSGATVLGAETVATEYDTASMPWWMSGGFGWGTYVAESAHRYDGLPLAMDLGNTYGAVVTYGWETGTNRLAQIALDREGIDGTEVQLGYTYDNAGNVTTITDTPTHAGAASSTDTQCFEYDGLRRLTTVWSPSDANCAVDTAQITWGQIGGPAPLWNEYEYDPLGNRTELVTHAADGATTTARQFGGGGAGPHAVTTQTTTAPGSAADSTVFEWDDAGNQTARANSTSVSAFEWDAEGELTSAAVDSSVTSSVYDANGNRLVRFDGTGATVYLPGGMEVASTIAGIVSATRWYTFAGKMVAARTGRGLAGFSSIVADHHGTPFARMNNVAWTVTRTWVGPFGAARTSANATAAGRGFLGAPHDQSGLVLLGARYYDADVGAFLSVDPLLDPENTAQLNAYVYSGNNPATWDDPAGLQWLMDADHPTLGSSLAGGSPQSIVSGSNGGATSTGRGVHLGSRIGFPLGSGASQYDRAMRLAYDSWVEWAGSDTGATLHQVGNANRGLMNDQIALATSSSPLAPLGLALNGLSFEGGQSTAALQVIHEKFRTDGEWDLKVRLRDDLGLPSRAVMLYAGPTSRSMRSDVPGNVVYGAMMANFGVSEEAAILASNAGGDAGLVDAPDDAAIRLGYYLFESYPSGVSFDQFTRAFAENPTEALITR